MKISAVWFIILIAFLPQILFGQQPLSSLSQKAVKIYQNALVKANQAHLEEAILLLNDAIKEDKGFIEAYLMQGELFMDNKQDKEAMESFKKGIAVNPEFFPPVYSNLATLEFNNALYEAASIHIAKYLTYKNISPASKTAGELLLKSSRFAAEAIKHPVPFEPRNLGPAINSHEDEYWPTLSADEQTLIFTMLVPINPNNPSPVRNRQEDFYYSTFENGEWTPARPVGPPVNTPKNEGAQTLSSDGKIMIFTGCNRADGFGNCDLYISHLEDNQWTVPVNMGKPINTSAKETQPSLSPDGKVLYFASTRPGGKGGLDIWKSSLSDAGVWGDPVNLGDSINTPYDEQSPFIHPDNQTLYFSSTGWPGMGRFDLFLSRKKDDNSWSAAKNLGYPINTNFSEEGLIVNAKGNTAYYSSTRTVDNGRDLYSFELYPEIRPTVVSYMKGKVFDNETHKRLRAHFELIDLATSKTIMDAWSDDYDGSFLICIPSGKDYALNVNKKGYLFYSDNFTMKGGDFTKPFLVDVPLQQIKIGEKVVMRNIFFDYNSFELKTESQIELNKLISFLKDNPTLLIEISGHTDNSGKIEYNRQLSEIRAKSVVDFLSANGIAPTRMISKGYGQSQPLSSNATEEGRAKNRRTEFKVLNK